jgi:hypothetical protein
MVQAEKPKVVPIKGFYLGYNSKDRLNQCPGLCTHYALSCVVAPDTYPGALLPHCWLPLPLPLLTEGEQQIWGTAQNGSAHDKQRVEDPKRAETRPLCRYRNPSCGCVRLEVCCGAGGLNGAAGAPPQQQWTPHPGLPFCAPIDLGIQRMLNNINGEP